MLIIFSPFNTNTSLAISMKAEFSDLTYRRVSLMDDKLSDTTILGLKDVFYKEWERKHKPDKKRFDSLLDWHIDYRKKKNRSISEIDKAIDIESYLSNTRKEMEDYRLKKVLEHIGLKELTSEWKYYNRKRDSILKLEDELCVRFFNLDIFEF